MHSDDGPFIVKC